jgi:hypothetical protein
MDEQDLLDLIAADDSQAQISDRIKDILSGKALEKIDELVPEVSAALFNGSKD